MVFEVGIGTSQKWEAELAAREALAQSLNKLSQKPTFILLFSTIHYEKNGGLNKILKTVYENVPKETALVGGTVAGFMNKSGVFSRGLTILSCYSDELDVVTGLAHNTKRNPKKAGKEFINLFRKKQPEKYSDGVLIDFISGPSIPSLPFIKKTNLVGSKFIGDLMSTFGLRLSSFLEFGVGKEEEVLDEIIKGEKTAIIGGSTTDNGKLISNYQFCNDKVLKNGVTGMFIYTNNKIFVGGFPEMTKTNVCFKVDGQSTEGRVIKSLNGEPATIALLTKLGFSKEIFKNLEQLYRTTFYFPISISDDDSFTTTIGAIYGGNLAIGHKLKTKNIKLLSASGERIVNSPINFKNILEKKNKLVLIVACETGMEALGGKIYKQKEKLESIINDSYLVVYCGGEHFATGDKLNVRTHSYNLLTIS
ncbi:MAG: FIST N-terminal domain-containing protein [Candidatus Diapherotrites archaeon]